MTDSDREKRARAALDRYNRCSMAERPVGHHMLDWMLSAFEAADEACPVVPLERAQELERERDEAREKLTEALGQAGRWADAYAGEIALRRAADSVARGFDRERDEAVAAARDFAATLAYMAEEDGDCPWAERQAAEVLARHPSFLPPDREE